MADVLVIVLLEEQTLTNDDASAIGVDFEPRDLWQPSILLQTPSDSLVTPTVAAAQDGQTLICAPEAAYPNYVFYCIGFDFNITEMPGGGAFGAFWEDDYGYCVQSPEPDARQNWRSGTLGPDTIYFDGTARERVRAGTPDLVNQPGRPMRSTSATVANNAMAAVSLRCATFDAASMANQRIHIDARFLGFPQAVTRSAGFYVPRMYGPIH